MQFAVVFLLLMVFALPCSADCDTQVERIADLLSRFTKHSERAFADCKVWPADPGKTIVAVAALQKLSSSGQISTLDDGVYALKVFVVTSGDGEILHRFVEDDALPSDSISLSGIAIDTARYRLASGVLAFGLRATQGNPRVEIIELDLYVASPDGLKRVLKGLRVVSRYSEQNTANCYRNDETELTIAVAKSTTRGYADLVIREKNVVTEPKRTRGECTMTKTRFARRYLLRFDGKSYQLPQAMKDER